MYNGIGLTTPRGSGTNGHVQRNWAFVRPGKKDNSNYRTEEDIHKLDATLNRPPNKEILDHDRKRKIEVKCLEFEEILEKQGLSPEEIKAKINSYRQKLMGQGKTNLPKDEFGRITVRDTHQIAEAQQEKNAKLREAFNISEYFVEGSSFDSDRKTKEDLAKSLALQKELDAQREQTTAAVAKDKESSKRYALVRTPSLEHDVTTVGVSGSNENNDDHTVKKKKKKRTRESSVSPDRKKEKKKKSKKRRKESKSKKSKKISRRKGSESESNSEHDKDSANEDSDVDSDTHAKKIRKKSKRDKKKRDKKNKKKERPSSLESSRSISPVDRFREHKNESEDVLEKKSLTKSYRSRSKEQLSKPKESNVRNFESSQESGNKSNRRNGADSNRRLSSSRSEKELYYRKHTSSSVDYSRECVDKDNYKSDTTYHHENRNSRSRQRSKHDDSSKGSKDLKRKRSEEFLHRKPHSPSLKKRNKHSCSPSYSGSRQTYDDEPLTRTTREKRSQYRTRSRTPKHNPPSTKEIYKKSLTPPVKFDQKIINSQEKPATHFSALYSKEAEHNVKERSRSRSPSMSSSDSASSTGTDSSTSRNLTKNKYLIKQRKWGSKSPISRRSSSNEKKQIIYERTSKDKQLPGTSKQNTEQHIKLKSRTPPPPLLEKKVTTTRCSRDSSELSYSPARRNPERYRDILDNLKNQKNDKYKLVEKDEERKGYEKAIKNNEERERDKREKGGRCEKSLTKPVVHLQSQSEDESDSTERNAEKILDEFQESKREREIKDLKMLERLKTGIAAKAKEKIKTIEKMAASTSSSSSNTSGEVSDKSYKRAIRNSLNDFLAANNVTPVVATCSSATYSNAQNSLRGAIYPQTLEDIKKEKETSMNLNETSSHVENNNNNNHKDTETLANCKKSPETANGHAISLSPTVSPLLNNANVVNRDRDRKRDYRERERDRETKTSRENITCNKERYLERRQKSSPNIYCSGGGGCGGLGAMGGGRRNNNSNIHHLNNRQQRLNANLMNNTGGVGVHHHHTHSHPHPIHHHHPNHQIINNHHNTLASPSTYIPNNVSTNPHTLLCNHANNSTNILFNRPSRINNTPLITATQFNNQMLSKQSNSILVNRRDHRTALNLGLSGTPCTNFSNSNLLLTKANTNPHHLHATAAGHGIVGGHHHHHHHHHGQNSSTSNVINPATQITDRILMAASIAAAQRHSLGVHSVASSAAAVAAANNLNFLQQNKTKLVIKPFKINDSQPLVAALADSSLVDAIVSKVSTATVAAAESAARRSRSRSRRSRNRHENTSSGSNNGGGGAERDGNRRRSGSHSRSSRSSSSSRSRSRSRRSSHSSQSTSTSRSSSRTPSSSSYGSSRSGTRSPSIPRRRGSPSFLDRRRITSARKRPIPYHRKQTSDVSSCYCSSCCSRDSSPRSRSPSRDSRSPSRIF